MLRRILFIVALLAVSIPAWASESFATQQLAYEACANAGATSTHPNKAGPWRCKVLSGSGPTNGQYVCEFQLTTGGGMWAACSSGTYWIWTGGCPAGTHWDEQSKTCFNPQQCLARNSEPGFANVGETVRPFRSHCVGGCKFAAVSTQPSVTVDGMTTGTFEFTGDVCGTPQVDPPMTDTDAKNPKPQECQTYPSGQKFCQKANGEQCYTTTNGRQNCWRPGETGEKNDGPVKQKRNAGPTEIPPENLQLPSGDSLQKQGESITKTTTITTNNSTATNTTTTTNYQTVNGTNAGDKNQGESGSGDGTGKEDDGEDGSASGGGDCNTPPIVSGDQVLGMVATQAWHTRCAVEAGNAAKVTGDVGDCAQPYTVEGNNANAHQLRAMRASICGQDINGNKRPDWTETNGTETPEPGEGDDEPGVVAKLINTDALDVGGFLGGGTSCPSMGVVDLKFAQVDLSSASWWCPFVSMCRAILLLMGAFIAVRLLME